jgi:uncharacterized protein YraI
MNIRKKLAVALLGAAVISPATAWAQELVGVAYVDLNVRAGPAPTYPVVTVISANDSVDIFGCLDDLNWCDVAYGGVRGWAYAEYLTVQTTPVPQVQATLLPPPVTFNGEEYWTAYYQDRPFFAERDRWFGGAAGAAGGAVLGALVFGPVGAAVGAAVGGAAGAVAGEAITPPEQVVTYVRQQQPQPVLLQGEVVIGAIVPDVVTLQPVPDYQYSYAYINGQLVLVAPDSRQIVYVIR